MIDDSEQVIEVDCDLDTLICWLQDNPDWSGKLVKTNTRKTATFHTRKRNRVVRFPVQLRMSSPSRFCVKVRSKFLELIIFSINQSGNMLEIRAGEQPNYRADVTKAYRQNWFRLKLQKLFYQLKTDLNRRTERHSQLYLEAFADQIRSAGLPLSKKSRKGGEISRLIAEIHDENVH